MGGFWTKILEDQHRPFIKNPLGETLKVYSEDACHSSASWKSMLPVAGLQGCSGLCTSELFDVSSPRPGILGLMGLVQGAIGSRLSRVECWRARPACRPTGPLFFGKTLILVRYPNCLGRCGPSVRPTGCDRSSSGIPTRRSRKFLQLLSRLQCTFNRVNCKPFPKGSQCHIRAIAVMGKPLKPQGHNLLPKSTRPSSNIANFEESAGPQSHLQRTPS